MKNTKPYTDGMDDLLNVFDKDHRHDQGFYAVCILFGIFNPGWFGIAGVLYSLGAIVLAAVVRVFIMRKLNINIRPIITVEQAERNKQLDIFIVLTVAKIVAVLFLFCMLFFIAIKLF